ncbi:MAG TPA: sigma-70 family RNA polymerase sigma factor [Acidobacteriaceae bacterium]|nr:sigma-70 family RNA polymerase sigma factor [Acidobacteriaceae bacterium]
MPDDREVWAAICRRDASVYDAFYREHAPRLRTFLQLIVGERQTAEDLTQETFVQIWKQPNGYDPERGALRAYLFGIGRKRASEWWRQQRPSDPLPEDWTDTDRAEVRAMVDDVFRRLPEEHRTLLWLREVEGQSYAELAVTFEIPMGTVRSRLFTAREALREAWHSRHPERERRLYEV